MMTVTHGPVASGARGVRPRRALDMNPVAPAGRRFPKEIRWTF